MSQIIIDFEPGYHGPTISGIVSHSETEREAWVYRYDERSHTLKPRAYRREIRETKRHRWNFKETWGFLESRIKRLEILPPPPRDMLSLIMARFIEELKIDEKGTQ